MIRSIKFHLDTYFKFCYKSNFKNYQVEIFAKLILLINEFYFLFLIFSYMKYTIFINQLPAVENNLNLDLTDLAIFDYVNFLGSSPRTRRVKDED